jgi:hypothetical protein
MNSENKKLKEMLNHVTGNYTALQMQLVALMQKNHHTENEVINYKLSLVYFNLKYEFIINVSVQ